VGVRTTLSLDPDVLAAAKQIAATRDASLGEVISELARRGLKARAQTSRRSGFPVFKVPSGAKPLTPEDVRQDDDEA
jgi:hypothetical protein